MLVDPIKVSEHIILRPLKENEVYTSWLNDPEVNQFLELRFKKWKSGDVKTYIKNMNESPSNLHLGIFYNSKHIGNITIRNYTPEHKRAEIAFLIGEKDYWGKGIASKSIIKLSDYAFTNLRLHKLWAGCYINNIASYKCLIKAGFNEEARLDGWFFFNDNPIKSVFLSKCMKKF